MSNEEEDTCMSDETLSAHRLQIPAYIIILVVVVVVVVIIVLIIVALEGDRENTWYAETGMTHDTWYVERPSLLLDLLCVGNKLFCHQQLLCRLLVPTHTHIHTQTHTYTHTHTHTHTHATHTHTHTRTHTHTHT
jgi:hypothetical protein